MRFKYEDFIRGLSIQCPPNGSLPQKCRSFRWVQEEIGLEVNFQPYLIKYGGRPKGWRNNPRLLCSGYAVSLYTTLENAVNRFDELREDTKNIYQRLGTHVAQGDLDENDGVMTKPDQKGHFDLHEFETAKLNAKFAIVHDLRK